MGRRYTAVWRPKLFFHVFWCYSCSADFEEGNNFRYACQGSKEGSQSSGIIARKLAVLLTGYEIVDGNNYSASISSGIKSVCCCLLLLTTHVVQENALKWHHLNSGSPQFLQLPKVSYVLKTSGTEFTVCEKFILKQKVWTKYCKVRL